MLHLIIKFLVRSRFQLSRPERVSAKIRRACDNYLALAGRVDAVSGTEEIEVPPMLGVDEDMRRWSMFMVLEHNAIVNRNITALIVSLVRGEQPEMIDQKRDVMPTAGAGEEQVEGFRRSVEDHLATVARLGRLRGTRRERHAIFGMLDAHGWHCMFGFHLRLHLRQAQLLAAGGAAGTPASPMAEGEGRHPG